MRNVSFLFIGLLAALAGCNWDKPHKQVPAIIKDTLVYTYKGFKQTDKNCINKPDSTCAIFSCSYPIFNNAPQLNALILKLLGNKLYTITNPDTILKRNADDFFRHYIEDTAAVANHFYYKSTDTILVARQDSGLLTLQAASYIYTGGAHGMENTSFINWDSKGNRSFTLKDLLIDGYQQRLNNIAEKIFRADEKLAHGASLHNNYFFKDDKFSLNNNFLITPKGLRFLYNPYEIKPYAAGRTELLINYDELKPLIRLNTILSQYYK